MTTPTTHAGRQRQMRGRRSLRNLLAAYDRSNDQAAEIILGDPARHTRFQINWRKNTQRAGRGRAGRFAKPALTRSKAPQREACVNR